MNKPEHQGIKNIATNYQLRKYLANTTPEERAIKDKRLRLMLAQNNIRIPRPTTRSTLRSTPRSTISSAVIAEINSIPSQYPQKIEDSLDILITKTGKGNKRTRRKGTKKRRGKGLGKGLGRRKQTYIKKR